MPLRGTCENFGAISRRFNDRRSFEALRRVRRRFEALTTGAAGGTTKNLVLLRVIHKVGAASRRFQIGAASRHCETVQKIGAASRHCGSSVRMHADAGNAGYSLCAAPMTPVAMTPMERGRLRCLSAGRKAARRQQGATFGRASPEKIPLQTPFNYNGAGTKCTACFFR